MQKWIEGLVNMSRRKKHKLKKQHQPQPASVTLYPAPRFAQMRPRGMPEVWDVPEPVEDMSARQYDPRVLTLVVQRSDHAWHDREYIDWDNCEDTDIKAFLEGW